MAGVRLLSIKVKEESSYFYDNKGTVNEDVAKEENKEEAGHKMSKKERKASQKEGKKDKKRQEKEQKEREKEMKKVRKSQKGTKSASEEEVRPENGGVSQVNQAVSKETVGENNNEDIKEVSHIQRTSIDSGMDTSTADNSPVNRPMNDEHGDHVIEDTITPEGAEHVEEAPPDMMYYRSKPEPITTEQGQHMEIEISEVTELEDAPDDPHDNVMTYTAAGPGEGEITVVTVQEVESGPELDQFFVDIFGESGSNPVESTRKSVRFQEPDEEDNVEDEHDDNDEDAEETQPEREQVVDDFTREEQKNVESSELNWDDIFPEAGQGAATAVPDNEVEDRREEVGGDRESVGDNDDASVHREVVVNHREVVVHHREVVVDHREVVEGHGDEVGKHRAEVGNEHVEITNNNDIVANGTQGEHSKNTAEKKDRRNRSKLWRCCYP